MALPPALRISIPASVALCCTVTTMACLARAGTASGIDGGAGAVLCASNVERRRGQRVKTIRDREETRRAQCMGLRKDVVYVSAESYLRLSSSCHFGQLFCHGN